MFLDGLGLGAADRNNPLSAPGSMPLLVQFLKQPLLMDARVARADVLLKPIDPTLGVAGLPFRMQYEYEQGEALYWNITGSARSPIFAEVAGRRLAALSDRYSATLFECYLCDYAGHAQNQAQAIEYLQRIDRFLASTIANLSPSVTLVVTSDHGNVEDLSTKRHTFNSVPLIAVGPHATDFLSVKDLTGIAPQILSLIGSL